MTGPLVQFQIENLFFALPVEHVVRVIRAVEVTPWPEAPPGVLGVVNVHGEIMPVVNLRKRFQLPERGVEPDDLFMMVECADRRLLIWVDAVHGVFSPETDAAQELRHIPRGMEYVLGIAREGERMVLIPDLKRLVTDEITGETLPKPFANAEPTSC